ncbi:MAG: DUF6067 family protein [Candidatus Hydrogenedentes bacterium]|nr:DUF6067 family protein [Candidatus Hydrogenedentota bacterium]
MVSADPRWAVDSWPRELGNHRALVQVSEPAGAVRVRLDWRRRDLHPESKAIYVLTPSTGERVANVLPRTVTREFGELIFEPAAGAGTYAIYFMPYRHAGPPHLFKTEYAVPDYAPDPKWLRKHKLGGSTISGDVWQKIPEAEVVAFESRSKFDRRDPMEVIATEQETRRLVAAHPGKTYLLFPEDRRYPIRMAEDMPLRWIQAGPNRPFHGSAQPGEFYAFQIGVFAAQQPLERIAVTFSGLQSAGGSEVITPGSFCCFNLGGTDGLGKAFSKDYSLPEGKVGALWCGVQIPKDAVCATYTGTVTVKPANALPTEIEMHIEVAGEVREDAGDAELWRHSRLRWLDSTIGIDNEVVAPYTPLVVAGNSVACLGRTVYFGDTGLPKEIMADRKVILAAPIQFVIETDNAPTAWTNIDAGFTGKTRGTVVWRARQESTAFEAVVSSKMDFDGYINCDVTLTAKENCSVSDMRLEIPLRPGAATYMMGMGRKGGYRPESWKWQWDINRANNSLWLGDVDAGLQCKLKDTEDWWDLYRLTSHGIPDAWGNHGQGGCNVSENDGTVLIRAYSGPRDLAKGQQLQFRFGLLPTPLKPLDPGHWNWRYYHRSGDPDLKEALGAGATIINVHQGGALNPHINYPFLNTDVMSDYVRRAHENGMKVKMYYTVRELSNYCVELHALRSLGFEIFTDGPGGGASWLHEHLVSNYAPAWHEPNLPGGKVDAAIATTGLSRWHNYYLEGLRWLFENVEIDGLYLDGIGYNREIMKRVRKVMQRSRPGSLIDFHSGNNFDPNYGLNNCANQYLEHLPYVDSIWFGEGFDYNESPDYWLVEVSGIPFGLFGEMLQGGGNPWRGMIYGMTNRYGWGGDPRPIWRVWDDFGIAEAKMLGYWDTQCPVRTSRKDVLVTAYVKPGETLLAIASWAESDVEVHLEFDWAALGLDSSKATLTASEISEFQPAASFAPADAIPVKAGRGWLLGLRSTRP